MAQYGTQPTIGRRGRGASQGVRPNRAPGRRNVGGARRPNQGGPKKPPNGPLHGGQAGEALANEEPEQFFDTLLYGAGYNPAEGNLVDEYSQMRADDLAREYNLAHEDNQNLSVQDWTKKTYGAGEYGGVVGKKGHKRRRPSDFRPGSLAFNADDPGYKSFVSNQTPGWINTQLSGQAHAGGTEFGTFINENFGNQIDQEFQNQINLPGGIQNKDQYLAANPRTMHRARRAWAMRPNTMRSPLPVTPEGRYSWWT